MWISIVLAKKNPLLEDTISFLPLLQEKKQFYFISLIINLETIKYIPKISKAFAVFFTFQYWLDLCKKYYSPFNLVEIMCWTLRNGLAPCVWSLITYSTAASRVLSFRNLLQVVVAVSLFTLMIQIYILHMYVDYSWVCIPPILMYSHHWNRMNL